MLAGFAFGTKALGWPSRNSPPDRKPLGSTPSVNLRNRWVYRAFDCVPASPLGLTVEDIVITAAVDSRIGSTAVLGMMAIADDVAAVLARIPVAQTFWDLKFLGPTPP